LTEVVDRSPGVRRDAVARLEAPKRPGLLCSPRGARPGLHACAHPPVCPSPRSQACDGMLSPDLSLPKSRCTR
jgi:hypothetical protein